MNELHRVHRPKTLEDVVGQPSAVKLLQAMVKKHEVPHAIAFTGSSGVGKTTMAKILRRMIGCGKRDFKEVNAAKERGIDMVREISGLMSAYPIEGKCRVWLIDEGQALTSDAQGALLTVLEEPPDHVYVFLCTTDFQKLRKALRDRCTEIRLNPVKDADVEQLVRRIMEKEGIKTADKVVGRIVETAAGCPREALNLLNKARQADDEAGQMELVMPEAVRLKAFEIVRALLWKRVGKWSDMARILRDVEETEDLESLRRAVLTSAANEMVKEGGMHGRAATVSMMFADDWFKTGKAGLRLACWECFQGGLKDEKA